MQPSSIDAHSTVRAAGEHDVARILALIVELAVYEREPDVVRTTEAQLRSALFGLSPAVFAHVVERDGEVIGIALWFRNFSTWEGTHGIYLEDLYVQPQYRGFGYGKALLKSLADVCVVNGFRRLEWSVLNWNAPSIAFYDSLGATPMSDWTTYRLTGDALSSVARQRE